MSLFNTRVQAHGVGGKAAAITISRGCPWISRQVLPEILSFSLRSHLRGYNSPAEVTNTYFKDNSNARFYKLYQSLHSAAM